jgi:hypothetical protein
MVGQILRGSYVNTWKLKIFVLLVFCFFMGAICASEAFRVWGYNALVVSAVLYLVIGVGCIVGVYEVNEITFWQAITGNWKVNRKVVLSLRKDSDLTDEELIRIFDTVDSDAIGKVSSDAG